MLADSRGIEGKVLGYFPPIRMQADLGTCDILPSMYRESAKIVDI